MIVLWTKRHNPALIHDVNLKEIPCLFHRVAGYYNHSANGTATVHEFDHPWFQTIIMFIGESFCLVGLAIQRKRERVKWRKEVCAIPLPPKNMLP